MPNLDEFDLDPVVSTAENGNDGISPKVTVLQQNLVL